MVESFSGCLKVEGTVADWLQLSFNKLDHHLYNTNLERNIRTRRLKKGCKGLSPLISSTPTFTVVHYMQTPRSSLKAVMDEPAPATQVLNDENLLAIVMDNIDDPKTMLNLIRVLPTVKVIFEHRPKQFLTATLASLPSELGQLAVLYITLLEDHLLPASTVALLEDYLHNCDTTGSALLPGAFSNPIETLNKLASVWSAIEDLTGGFAESTIMFIEQCKVAKAAGLETLYYERGHKLRPVSHLWDPEITLEGRPGYPFPDKPQPWSLPLRASETHRIKRAFWRLEVFATLSRSAYDFAKESAVRPTTTQIHCRGAFEEMAQPQDSDLGMDAFRASLRPSEFAELDSVYDYLWRQTIGKAYQDRIDPNVGPYFKEVQQTQAEREAGTTSHSPYRWTQRQCHLHARRARQSEIYKATKDPHYLTCYMSLGLPFLQQVRQQMTGDGDEVALDNYPPLQYCSFAGLQGQWNGKDRSRSEVRWGSYKLELDYGRPESEVDADDAVWHAPDPSGVHKPNACNVFVNTRTSAHFHFGEMWRAGCYMWEGGRK